MRTVERSIAGPWSPGAAGRMRFGPREATPDGTIRLAFARDDHAGTAGAIVRLVDSTTVRVDVHGDGDGEAVADQALRILSLHHDATGWAELAASDPHLQGAWSRHPGLRPVQFGSPWEAAAWGVVSLRRQRPQALALRRGLAEGLGDAYDLDGARMHAFPSPDRILEAAELSGVPDTPAQRLRGLAAAALDGELDAATLAAEDPEAAMARLLELPGLGPFWASLVLIRATGRADAPLDQTPRLDALLAGADPAAWVPWRVWAAVLLRVDAGGGP